MKIFITGADGQLAKSYMERYPGSEIFSANKKILDIRNKKEVFKNVELFKPDIIFHFASITRGDECARDPKNAYNVNVGGTKNVVEVCRKYNITLLFVSTNEVFSGNKKDYYSEKDIPNPISIVGKTKYDAEKVIKENLNKYYIIRTSWLYSKFSKNFLHGVFLKAKKNKKIKLVVDEISSPTYSLDLCIGINKLISTKKYGLYHLSNNGKASRLEFAKEAFDISGFKNVAISPVTLKDFKRFSKPPLFTPLSNDKAIKNGIIMPSWKNGLKRYLSEVQYKV